MSAGGRSSKAAWLLFGAMVIAGLLFTALGGWQLQRREWKLRLIATVQQRVAADAVPLQELNSATAPADFEYRRVRLSGTYLPRAPTLTQAVTRLGAGYWVLQPFRSDADVTVFVNRGFVPASVRAGSVPAAPGGVVELVGLLRRSEPTGGFLRRNDPAAQRWFSRDVPAIARSERLAAVAPWFVDAETTQPGVGQPVGGLTVVQFRNAHLSYALTWFGLAALAAFGACIVLRDLARTRHRARTLIST